MSESDPIVLSGPLYTRLIPLLDGQRSVEAILDALKGQSPFMAIQYALSSLEQKGYITENLLADNSVTPEAAAFWSSLGIDASQAATCLENTPVSIAAFGNVLIEPMLPILIG